MVSINRFCAECGSTSVPLYENFCQNCYWKFHSTINPTSNKFDFTICNECFSVKLPSGWTSVQNIDQVPNEISYAVIKYLRAQPETSVEINQISLVDWSNPKPEFQIIYNTINDAIEEFEPHLEPYSVEIGIERGICKVCVTKKTGSSSTTVQLRAKNRELTNKEISKYTELAIKLTNDQPLENQTAYLSDIIQNHGGLDFYFGSQWLAESFVSELQKITLGHSEKNYKLITEDKKGQRVYSVTYLYRIPEVSAGDIIAHENELFNVINITKRSIMLRSLVDRSKIAIYEWDLLAQLKISPEKVKKIVISKDYATETYLLMDSESYVNEEVPNNRFYEDLEIGAEIELLKWENKYYLPL